MYKNARTCCVVLLHVTALFSRDTTCHENNVNNFSCNINMNKIKFREDVSPPKHMCTDLKKLYETTVFTNASRQTRNLLEHFDQLSAIPRIILRSNDTMIPTC